MYILDFYKRLFCIFYENSNFKELTVKTSNLSLISDSNFFFFSKIVLNYSQMQVAYNNQVCCFEYVTQV